MEKTVRNVTMLDAVDRLRAADTKQDIVCIAALYKNGTLIQNYGAIAFKQFPSGSIQIEMRGDFSVYLPDPKSGTWTMFPSEFESQSLRYVDFDKNLEITFEFA